MAGQEQTLNTDYLKRHCPLAWNTPEDQETYARLGYDIVGEAFRIVGEALGEEGSVAPERLPVRLDLAFSVQAADGPPIVRVAKRQEGEPKPDPDAAPCGPAKDKPTLTARYLREHAVTTCDDKAEQAAYEFLGYTARRDLVHGLIAQGGEGKAEAHRALTVTVDTTWTAGGCAIVCMGSNCAHKARPH